MSSVAEPPEAMALKNGPLSGNVHTVCQGTVGSRTHTEKASTCRRLAAA